MGAFSDWILSKDPTVYYRLNEASGVPQDSSGNGNHMATDTISTYQRPGLLTGDSDYAVSLGAGQGAESGLGFVDLPSTAMTWTALVKATGGAPQAFSNIMTQAWTHAGGFIIYESATIWYVGVQDATPTSRIVNTGSFIPRDGQRHRLIGTYDGTTIRAYMDGVKIGPDVAIVNPPATVWNPSYIFTLGAPKAATDISFDVDEVSVHKTAWSAEEVAQDWAYITNTPVPPTLVPGSAMVANTDSAAPFTLSVAMPTPHATNDILFVLGMQNGAADLSTSTSGWAVVPGTAQNNASFSTCLFWKRAASASEPNLVITSSASGGTTGIAAFPFIGRGCITTGTPWEDLTIAGSPTSGTVPPSSAIDTVGTGRRALAIAAIGDNNTITNYPPSGWQAGANVNSATGTDYAVVIIQKPVTEASAVAAVNICTQSAADFYRTFTLALIPPPLPVSTSRLKRWNGSAWVVANFKSHNGSIWVPATWKKLP